jgi:ATP-dependent Clp protease protease subunit
MMPIGVPRVPYRTPKEGGWQWVDIWNCLYRDRIIFLSKPVDEELGNQVGGWVGGCGLVVQLWRQTGAP